MFLLSCVTWFSRKRQEGRSFIEGVVFFTFSEEEITIIKHVRVILSCCGNLCLQYILG
jgi:hypothetical protein